MDFDKFIHQELISSFIVEMYSLFETFPKFVTDKSNIINGIIKLLIY